MAPNISLNLLADVITKSDTDNEEPLENYALFFGRNLSINPKRWARVISYKLCADINSSLDEELVKMLSKNTKVCDFEMVTVIDTFESIVSNNNMTMKRDLFLFFMEEAYDLFSVTNIVRNRFLRQKSATNNVGDTVKEEKIIE